jgi:hypothetical protein
VARMLRCKNIEWASWQRSKMPKAYTPVAYIRAGSFDRVAGQDEEIIL